MENKLTKYAESLSNTYLKILAKGMIDFKETGILECTSVKAEISVVRNIVGNLSYPEALTLTINILKDEITKRYSIQNN